MRRARSHISAGYGDIQPGATHSNGDACPTDRHAKPDPTHPNADPHPANRDVDSDPTDRNPDPYPARGYGYHH